MLGYVLGAFRVVCCRVNRSLAGVFGGFAPREVAGGSPGERALGGVQPPATALSRRPPTVRLSRSRATVRDWGALHAPPGALASNRFALPGPPSKFPGGGPIQ